ncbi:hypothetical protein ACFPOI_34785 [Nonomuraea angiospora]|uniref:Uncharacterized protein n=1 Tax=Nonomuraea angiospora TaxID=46172 RepID=A0ABR9M850_9ACTN|nr:hypothetical protein [Nonomuraea angiospora]MBE1589081.1 hypothetical protein [Nonomuraea angiospora]
MSRRLITEVAGVIEAPVERVWPEIVRAIPRTELGEHRLAYQGGWWYRGEWSVTADPEGTRLVHRVYDVAGNHWAVALANRLFIGFRERTRRSFAEGLADLGNRLGCATRLA